MSRPRGGYRPGAGRKPIALSEADRRAIYNACCAVRRRFIERRIEQQWRERVEAVRFGTELQETFDVLRASRRRPPGDAWIDHQDRRAAVTKALRRGGRRPYGAQMMGRTFKIVARCSGKLIGQRLRPSRVRRVWQAMASVFDF